MLAAPPPATFFGAIRNIGRGLVDCIVSYGYSAVMWNTPTCAKDLTGDDVNRFWRKVRIAGKDKCWEWIASFGSTGYGQFMVRGKVFKEHRFAFLISKGDVPNGLFVCHRCDNPKCVNPAHLFTGTHTDNEHDKHRKNRHQSGARHWTRRNPELIGCCKLKDSDVSNIRIERECGVKFSDIANSYGVHVTTIQRIIYGKTWRQA